MTPEKKISAKLYPVDRDLSKPWFIKYQRRNWKTGKLDWRIGYGALNLYDTAEERLQLANQYIAMVQAGQKIPSYQGQRYKPVQATSQHWANTVALCEKYLPYLAKDVEPFTYSGYKVTLKLFTQWMTDQGYMALPIGQFTKSMVRAFMDYASTTRHLANGTVNEHKLNMAKVFDEILECNDDLQMMNPWRMVKSLKAKRTKAASMRIDNERKIMKHLPKYNPQMWLNSLFIYYASMRPTETLRLKLGNIDWERGSLRLSYPVVRKSEERTILIPYPLMDLLLEKGYDQLDHGLFVFSHHGEPGPKPLCRNHFNKRFAEFRKVFDIPDTEYLYKLKHTANNRVLQLADIHPKAMQEHNGHASLDMTAHYMGQLNLSAKIPLREAYPDMGKQMDTQDTAYQQYYQSKISQRNAH